MTDSPDTPSRSLVPIELQNPIDPRLIDQLFNEDPMKLEDRDIDLIISALRADRALYIQETSKPKLKKGEDVKTKELAAQIDLKDLGLL